MEDDREFCFQRHIAILYPDEKQILPEYLSSWLNSWHGKRWSDIAAVGNAQKTVTLGALGKIPIALPPLDEQIQICEILSRIGATEFAMEQKIEALIATRKNLANDLLNGSFLVN